jgi:hypothetical protein
MIICCRVGYLHGSSVPIDALDVVFFGTGMSAVVAVDVNVDVVADVEVDVVVVVNTGGPVPTVVLVVSDVVEVSVHVISSCNYEFTYLKVK